MNVGASGESFYILWQMRLGGLELNTEEAAQAFLARHGRQPNICYGHSSVVNTGTAAGLVVKADDRVRPLTLKVGWEPGGAS